MGFHTQVLGAVMKSRKWNNNASWFVQSASTATKECPLPLLKKKKGLRDGGSSCVKERKLPRAHAHVYGALGVASRNVNRLLYISRAIRCRQNKTTRVLTNVCAKIGHMPTPV